MKYCGNIGFMHTENDGDGIWTERMVVKKFCGDVTSYSSKWQTDSSKQNDDLSVSVSISIVANAFARNYFSEIRYCEWMGVKWKVANVDPTQPPRLILTLGGVYNGEE